MKAWGYYLGTFDLLTSPRGVVAGASYTDVKAQLPALRILIFIAVACAVLFFVNIRLRGWALPVIAVGLLALVSVVAGAAYPAFVQRFRVGAAGAPARAPVHRAQHRGDAHGLRPGPDRDAATHRGELGHVAGRSGTTPRRSRTSGCGGPRSCARTSKALQRIRLYYEFSDVDVDRYPIGGARRLVMVSAREVSQDAIPTGGGTWQNRHLVYTHGFGAVASAVNAATTEGAPQFTLQDIPPVGEPALEGNGQRVYYGERQRRGASCVVKTGADELDYQGTASDDSGAGDVPVRRRRRDPDRRVLPARAVRLALQGREPADLRPRSRATAGS